MTVLETERMVLRPVRASDAPSMQRYFATRDVIRYLSAQVPWPYPEDGVETYLRDVVLPGVARGDLRVWALTIKPSDEAVGMLEYRCGPDATDHRGFWIGVPFQGRGYMTEAVTAFQDHVFFDLGVDRLVVHNAVVNPRSRRIKEKTGAVYVGLVNLPHHSGDGTTEQWEVTRDRWARLRGRA